MIIPKIQEYAVEQLKLGKTEEEVKTSLRSVGWNELDISESVKAILLKGIKVKKVKKKRRKGPFLLFLLLFLTIGSTSAYYYVESQPIYILNKSYSISENIITSKFTIKIDVKAEGATEFMTVLNGEPLGEDVQDSFDLTFAAEGAYDITSLEVPELSVNVTTDLSNIIDDSGDAELIYKYKLGKAYIDIEELNNLEALDLDPYIGQWISADIPFPGYIAQEDPLGYKFSLEEQYYMYEKSTELGFIALEKTSSSELVSNSAVHTIKYTLDLTKAPEFYDFMRTYKPDLPEMTKEQKNSLINSNGAIPELITGKFYISKTNSSLVKFTSLVKIKYKGSLTTLNIETEFFDQNMPTNIVVPTETLPWEQIKDEFEAQLEASLLGLDTTLPAGTAQAFARDQKRNLDLQKIIQGLKEFLTKNGAISILFTSCEDDKQEIGTTPGHMDLKAMLVPDFMYTFPKDSVSGTDENTGYALCLTEDKKVNVLALEGETDMPLSLYFDMPE